LKDKVKKVVMTWTSPSHSLSMVILDGWIKFLCWDVMPNQAANSTLLLDCPEVHLNVLDK